jgi:hypothetical protein
VPNPNPSIGGDAFNQLNALAAASAGNVWAVGDYNDGHAFQAFAAHCCGG